MRAEGQFTERHGHQWSPSVKLRDARINFVSAGQIDPLEEQEVSKIDCSEGDVDEENANDQQHNGKMQDDSAQKRKDREGSLVESQAAIEKLQKLKVVDTKPLVVEEAEQGFFVDATGDSKLAPKLHHAGPVYSTQTMEESEDEVIVFRGRNAILIRDDPVSSSKSTTLKETVTPNSTSGHQAPVVNRQLLQGQDDSRQQKYLDTLDVDVVYNARKGSEVISPKTFPSTKPGKKVSGKKAGRRRRASAAINKQTRVQHAFVSDEDIEEALLQDYIENMSGVEDIVKAGQKQSDDDEWASSVIDEEEGDARRIVVVEETIANGNNATNFEMSEFGNLISTLVADGKEEILDEQVEVEDDDNDEDEDDEDDEDEDSSDDPAEGDEDEDGTTDPGDDSDLESDLSNSRRRRSNKDDDLRKRQIESLSDEQLARILAKQESLGLGCEEIILLDDSGLHNGVGDILRAEEGLEAILANPNHPSTRRNKRKGSSRKSDHFPSATLMADVLEQDPYNGFDIMDFDRPSLRSSTSKGRKSRNFSGGMPEELLVDLSDSDLVSNLQSSWANDRQRKASRKIEREELRLQGLLGNNSRRSSKNKFKPDLAVKFAEGLTLSQLHDEIESFLLDTTSTTKAFPPMEKSERKALHDVANVFDLTSTSRGSGKNRFTLFSKRQRTPTFMDEARWDRVLKVMNRGFLKSSIRSRKSSAIPTRSRGTSNFGGKAGASMSAVSYANGEIVGAAAPEIPEGSFGRKLLEKMGWEKGMALGKDGAVGGGGMLVPVEARVKSGRGGLG